MSKQQQLELIATLRQGQLDLGADVATLRVAFNDLMARIPVASDVDHVPTTIGGVNATVLGAALTPGLAGVYQVAVQVPAGALQGDALVKASIAGIASPDNVYLYISGN